MATINNTPKPRSIADDSAKALTRLQKESDSVSEEENTEIKVNEDGTVTVDFIEKSLEEESSLGAFDETQDHYANLVDQIDEEQLTKLAQIVLNNVTNDENARNEWMKTIEFGLDLLGVKVEEKNTPFEGACSAQHPLLMESAVKFQSKASNELLPANGPVRTKVLGDVTLEKEQQANRVRAHMNYQITEEMTE